MVLWPPRGHGNSCAAQPDTGPIPLLSQATAASKWVDMVGVRSAWQQPGGPFGTTAVMPQILPGTSAVAVRMPSRSRTPADALPRAGVTRQVRRLRKLVAGLAAAGGMQPAPVDACEPGG
jgi:hypothetical protein